MGKLREKILTKQWQAKTGRLEFSCKVVTLSLYEGEQAEGFFTVSAPEGMSASGFVSCKDTRMVCLTSEFEGNIEQIAYRFDAGGIQETETREGKFFILSDFGEYELPYRVDIREKTLDSSLGEIRNLFHFTNLARANWREAAALFYKPGFEKILDPKEEFVINLYRGLSREPGNEDNVEEFLLAVRKKQPVIYSCMQKAILVPQLRGQAREEILIEKSGWGAIELLVRTEGDFLFIEKERLTADDFLGNQYRFPVMLTEEKLHRGKNFGRVCFSHRDGSFCVEFEVDYDVERQSPKNKRRREEKQCILEMVRLYQEMRMKKLDAKQWRSKARECVERMSRLADKNPLPRLFQAQLLLTENKREEAGWILEHTSPFSEDRDPALTAYYLYLTTLYNREEAYREKALGQIEALFARNPGDWRIAWLLLFISHKLHRSASRKWDFLEGRFALGCRSPVLYLEALLLLNANPALLLKLDGPVKQILMYGAKNRILGVDLTGQLLYLVGKEKCYDAILFRILCLCYEERPDVDTLQAICTLLIKGGKTGSKYYPWYFQGVCQKLRVAQLYEHFMMSLDPEEEADIPKPVLLYFAYQSSLDYEYAACLYACVARQSESEPELYAAYRPQIDRFLTQQLQKGRVNLHLARLYQALVQDQLLTKENGAALAALLSASRVCFETKGRRKLAVVHSYLEEEDSVLSQAKTAYVNFYGSEDLLFLQEENGARRLLTGKVHTEALFTDREIRQRVAPFVTDNVGFCLSGIHKGSVDIDSQNVGGYLAAACLAGTDVAFGRQVRMGLLRFFFEQDRTEEMDRLLERLNIEDIGYKDRVEAVRLLTLRGFYEKAFNWSRGMDVKSQDARIWMRLASRLLEQGYTQENDRLTRLCYEAAIQGKYDGNILKRLVEQYEGGYREMEVIRQAAESFCIDTYALCERILERMLFVGADVTERMDLLRQYMREGGSWELVGAFLHRCAYGYVVQKQPIHTYMIQVIGQLLRGGGKVSDLCKIAWMEYNARNRDSADPGTEELILRLGNEFLRRGWALPVLVRFGSLLPEAAFLEDKSFVVFLSEGPEAPARLHYRILQGEDVNIDYSSVPMNHICEGIYTASFLLFAGEILQYFITQDGQEGIIESGLLKASTAEGAGSTSRYAMLNGVTLRQLAARDGGSLQELEQYLHRASCVSCLFGPIA